MTILPGTDTSPWTERYLQAASELMELSGVLEDAELTQFKTDLDSLKKDTPQTKVASFRVKTILGKVGKEIASGYVISWLT